MRGAHTTRNENRHIPAHCHHTEEPREALGSARTGSTESYSTGAGTAGVGREAGVHGQNALGVRRSSRRAAVASRGGNGGRDRIPGRAFAKPTGRMERIDSPQGFMASSQE